MVAAELLKTLGNRVATEEEALLLQEPLKEDNGLAELLKRGQEIRIARLQMEERITNACRRSQTSTKSLLLATNSLLHSIEQLQATFDLGLPDQEHPDVASRLPATEKYVSEWRFAFEALSGVSDLLLQRMTDAGERETTCAAHLQLHESLAVHAAQAVKHIDASIHAICLSIDDKRLGVLHPMRRLSVEIFSEIFRYAVDEEYNDLMDLSLSANVPAQRHLPTVAFNIAATCRHWRKIATATPKLWRYICAPWATLVQGNKGRDIVVVGKARFERCLALAGNTNLELTVREREHSNWKPILEDEGTREWSYIHLIDVPNLPARLPCAPRLRVGFTNHLNSEVNLPAALLSSTYHLRCTSCLPRITTPIPELRELDIWLSTKYVTFPGLGPLLTFLPKLEKLKLNCDHDFYFRWIKDGRRHGHHPLQSLSIMTRFASYLTFELQFITLPFLKKLKILDMGIGFDTDDVSPLLASPISISDTIKSLSIRCTKPMLKNEEIRTLIRSLPKLTSLTLDQFAVVPGLEALLDTSAPDQLHGIMVKRCEEEEKVNELIKRLHSVSPRLTINTRR